MLYVTVQFGDPLFQEMGRRLEASFKRHSPRDVFILMPSLDEDVEVQSALVPRIFNFNYVENVRKTKHHCRLINEKFQDGTVVGLMDSDMLVVGELDLQLPRGTDLVFAKSDDWRINTGVYWVVVNDRTKEWMRIWYAKALEFLGDPKAHGPYRKEYGGINQAALGWMLERLGTAQVPTVNVGYTSCSSWNCTLGRYCPYYSGTRILHFQAGWARNIIVHGEPIPESLPEDQAEALLFAQQEWRKYEPTVGVNNGTSQSSSDYRRQTVYTG